MTNIIPSPSQPVVVETSTNYRTLPPDHALERDDWSKRRLRLDLVLVLFAGLLSYIVLTNKANVVDQLVVPSLIAGIVSLIAAYVFGAVWDYKSFMSSIADMSQRSTSVDNRFDNVSR